MILGSTYFLLCAIACVAGALATVMSRNPIRGALGLLLTIVGISGLYLKLHAQFLAAIQLIVYAGAVVVLFVFVLMLLGADATDRSTTRRVAVSRWAGGLGLLAVMLLGAWRALGVYARGVVGKYSGNLSDDFGSVKSVGQQLFGDALLPFELATALLIVAVVGAIAVAQTTKRTAAQPTKRSTGAHRFFAGPIAPRTATGPVAKEPTR
jgi:NADH-quinone oxidoreductase subunit J